MSVLIEGMEMPTSCMTCLFQTPYMGGWCSLLNDNSNAYSRRRDCPLIPVPKHGLLIEESRVLDIISEWCPDDDGSVGKVGDLREMLDEIEALPTIIPADPEEEEMK